MTLAKPLRPLRVVLGCLRNKEGQSHCKYTETDKTDRRQRGARPPADPRTWTWIGETGNATQIGASRKLGENCWKGS